MTRLSHLRISTPFFTTSLKHVRIYFRRNAFRFPGVNLIHGQWADVRLLYNVSLITSINPTKEFIPSLSIYRRGYSRYIRGYRRGESWFDIFHAHARNICAGMRISSPRRNRRAPTLSRSPLKSPRLSLSLFPSHALQINVDVPGTKFQRVVLSVVQHEQYVKEQK